MFIIEERDHGVLNKITIRVVQDVSDRAARRAGAGHSWNVERRAWRFPPHDMTYLCRRQVGGVSNDANVIDPKQYLRANGRGTDTETTYLGSRGCEYGL